MFGIAIKGSNMYGSLVIKLLETLGGINRSVWGSCEETYYYIDQKTGYIEQKDIYVFDKEDEAFVESHTLIENILDFSTKYPYITGDRVYYDDSLNIGKIYRSYAEYDDNNKFVKLLYIVDTGNGKLIRGIEEENLCLVSEKTRKCSTQDEIIKTSNEILVKLPENYVFDRVIVDNGDSFAVCIPNNPKLPTEFDDVRKVMNIESSTIIDYLNGDPLTKLITFRNAWWKILNFNPKKDNSNVFIITNNNLGGIEIQLRTASEVLYLPWKFPTRKIAKQFSEVFSYLFEQL